MNRDVFISYRHSRKAEVVAFCEQLRAANISFFRDEDHRADDPSLQNGIETGLAQSKMLLAWFDPTYLESSACAWELSRALRAARHHGESAAQRIFCIDPTGQFSHIVPEELWDRARALSTQHPEACIAQLQAALSCIGKPFGEIPAEDGEVWYERECPSHPTWVGRERKLNELFAQLYRGKTAIKGDQRARVVITGCGGEGKTMLAEQYGIRYGVAYPAGIVWLSGAAATIEADSSTGWVHHLEQALAEIAQGSKLRLQTGSLLQGVENPRQRIKVLKHAIEEKLSGTVADPARRSSYLWIVDDMPSLSSTQDLLLWAPARSGVHCIVTMREAIAANVFREVRLESLSERQALAILTKHLPAHTSAEKDAALSIVELLGRLPLALELAACAVRTYTAFVELLRRPLDVGLEPLLNELRQALPTDHARSIVQTFDRSLALLKGSEDVATGSLDEATWTLMRVAALLSPLAVPDSLALQIFRVMGFADVSFSVALIRVGEAAIVQRCGASKQLGSKMHVLLARTVVDTRMNQTQRSAVIRAAVTAAAGLIEQEGARERPVDVDERLFPVVRKVFELADSAECAEGALAAGEVAFRIGRWADAVSFFERSAVIREGCFGPKSSLTADANEQLGLAMMIQGNATRARSLLEEVVSVRLLDHRNNDRVTLDASTHLASAHYAARDFVKARTMQEWIVEQRKSIDPQGLATLGSISNLALTVEALGDLALARTLHEEALAGRELRLPKDHRDTLDSKHNLAVCMQCVGDFEAAERLQRQVLLAYDNECGPESAETLSAMHNLAITLRCRREYRAACDLLKVAVEVQRRTLGATHPATLSAAHEWAEAMLALGEADEALVLLQAVISVRSAEERSDHPATFNTRSALARAMFARGRLGEARVEQESLLMDQLRALPDGDPQITETAANLLCTAQAQGDLGRVAELTRQFQAIDAGS